MLVLGSIFSLGALVLAIIMLIDAFKQSVGLGFACLCIPFVIIWFGYARFRHPNKNAIAGGYVACFILSWACNAAGGGMSMGG